MNPIIGFNLDRPFNQQVGSSASGAVLPVDTPATVHDALQERLHDKLRGGFLVEESIFPYIRVLAVELLECRQELWHVEP
ncbi:MAG: hypothetical protein FWG48_06430, partial [Oscillospiraceae bacterium]|nr:hypothetical protein [Oscillospiraceae bacterium]